MDTTNIPIAIGLILVMYPPLAKVREDASLSSLISRPTRMLPGFSLPTDHISRTAPVLAEVTILE